MQPEYIDDAWVLPSHQGEYPGRPVLADALLHRRRERTFLVLVTLFVAATAAMVILGTSRIIDVTYALATQFPELAVPFDLALPLGVLAFPISLFAVTLVCELYGRRRANALVMMGLVASVGLAGLMFVADRLDHAEAGFGPALAFIACYLVAHVSNLMIFDALRRRMDGRHPVIRKTLATLLAQVGGWAAFAFVSYGYAVYVGGQDGAIADSIATLALGSALYVAAVAIVELIPFGIAARTLTDYLRVEVAGDEDVEVVELQLPAFVKAQVHPSLNLYTTGERRFFTEGEELSEVR